MKKKNLTNGKLSLNKKAISHLDESNLDQIQGGITFTCCTEVVIKTKVSEDLAEDTSVHYSCGS